MASKTLKEIKSLNPKLEKVFNKLISRLLSSHLIGSTLVEGSTLTESEAKKVLEGQSIYGHVIDEHLELVNGKNAASYLHRVFFEKQIISNIQIDKTHSLLFESFGNVHKTHPGENRGENGNAAYTILLKSSKQIKFNYSHPQIIRQEYNPFINYHINKPLTENKKEFSLRLAQLYFQFQMLHPYNDGNGRIGRFLISAKVASELAKFFRFEVSDGPEHLSIMMEMTYQYSKNKDKVEHKKLVKFIDQHLEDI